MTPRQFNSVVDESARESQVLAMGVLSESVGRVNHSLTGMGPQVLQAQRERNALRDGRHAFETELAWMRGSLAEARLRHRDFRPRSREPIEKMKASRVWVPAVAVSMAVHAFLLTSPSLSLDPPPQFLLPTHDASFIHILSISELKTPSVRRSIAPAMNTQTETLSQNVSDPTLPTPEDQEHAHTDVRLLQAPDSADNRQDSRQHTEGPQATPKTTLAPTQSAGVVFVRSPDSEEAKVDPRDAMAISDRSVAAKLLDRSALASLTEGRNPTGHGEAAGKDASSKQNHEPEPSEVDGSVQGATGTSPHEPIVDVAGQERNVSAETGSVAPSPDAGLEPLPVEAIVAGTHTLIAPGDQQGASWAKGDASAAPTGNTALDALTEGSSTLAAARLPLAEDGTKQTGRNSRARNSQARRWGLTRRSKTPGQANDRIARLGQHFRLRGRAQETISESASLQAAAQQPSPSRQASSGGGSKSPKTVVPDIVALGNASRVPSRETPLGRYLAGVDDFLRTGWVLPLEVRALGVQGACEVTFTVDSRGRVQNKYLSRRSGRIELDRLALSAVPSRLKKMPSELPVDTLTVRYTFRSTDTLIAGSR